MKPHYLLYPISLMLTGIALAALLVAVVSISTTPTQPMSVNGQKVLIADISAMLGTEPMKFVFPSDAMYGQLDTPADVQPAGGYKTFQNTVTTYQLQGSTTPTYLELK